MSVSGILRFLKAALTKDIEANTAVQGLSTLGQLLAAMPMAFFYNVLVALRGMGATDTSDVEVSQVQGNNKAFRIYHRGNYVAEIEFEMSEGDPDLIGLACSFRMHYSPTAVESIERLGKMGKFHEVIDVPGN